MKPLLWISGCLGMGDAIILNGLWRTLANKYSVVIPCYPHNYPSVHWMLYDTDVSIHQVSTHQDSLQVGAKYPNRLMLGFEGEDFDRTHFDQSFYKQASLPFSLRWEAFSYPPPIHMAPVPKKPYKFIHDDKERGYTINLDGYRPMKDGPWNLFQYVDVINGAEEVHVIQSSFLHLIESLPETGQKLVYHESARKGDNPTLKRKWEVV